jgi:hypothetical protein
MKFGYISNNLSNKINNYLNNKAIEIEYKKQKPIDEKNLIATIDEVKKIELTTILIDSTCFYTEELALEFCYKLKVNQPNTRIILISFTKKLLSEIAMLGIYDIIYYEKNIDLSEKLDRLLIHYNSLKDIDEYLNLEHIKSNTDSGISNCEIILFVSLDQKNYMSTCAMKYTELVAQESETCYIEGPCNFNKLRNEFNIYDLASTSDLNQDKFKFKNYDLIFDDLITWKKEDVLNILLNVKTKYQCAIIDLGCIENLNSEIYQEILKYSSKLIVFDTNSSRRQKNPRYIELKNKILEYDKELLYVNPKSVEINEETDFDKEFLTKIQNVFEPVLPTKQKQEKFKFFDVKLKFGKSNDKIKK